MARPKTNVRTLYRLTGVTPTAYGMLEAVDLDKLEQLGTHPVEKTIAGMPALWIEGSFEVEEASFCGDVRITVGSATSIPERRAAALLLVAVDGVPYAIGYGEGYRLLKDERKDHAFGLRFGARRLDPAHIQGMVRRRPGARGRTDALYVPAGLPVWALGVEEQIEIVRRIGGQARDLKVSFSASDDRPVRIESGAGVTMRFAVDPALLVADIREVARVCAEEKPHPSLEFIEHIRPVHDAALAPRLDGELDRLLGQAAEATTDVIAVVPTELVGEYGRARCFTIKIGSAAARCVDFLDVEEFLRRTRLQPPGRRVESLRNGHVRMYGDDRRAEDLGGRAALKWLEATVTFGARRFFLVEGQWYEIDVTYLNRLRSEIVDYFVKRPSVDLMPWDGEKRENTYCRHAAVRSGFLCLDTKLVRTGYLRGGGGFEPCDLLGPGNELIHAKFARGADTLSHVFTQGVASALALLDNAEARARFAQTVRDVGRGRVIDPGFVPEVVVFALLPQKPRKGGRSTPRQMTPDTLFPLAQVALANAARLLRARGVRVEVVGVPIADPLEQAA